MAALIAAVVAAAALRLWGLRWGLPDALHSFTYHPDEVFQVGAMVQVDPFRLQLDPGFYNYPSGYMNLGALVIRVVEGWSPGITDAEYYLAARLVTVLLAVLTVPVVYSAGARLYGRSAGIIAAFLTALMPLHIVHSHFATVDVPATLWVALAILGAALLLTRPTLKAYLVAGVAVGFAAGTKYSAVLVLLPVVVAHFVREGGGPFRRRAADRFVWAMLCASVVGFLIATPGIIFWPERYAAGFFYEIKHAATGHGLVFVGKGPGWLDVMANSLGYGLGVVMLVLALLALANAIARHRREDWVLLSFVIPYFLMISFAEVRFTRYAMAMLPVIAILTARLMVDIFTVLKEHGSPILRWGWAAVCVGAVVYTAVYAAAFARLFTLTDPRTRAAEWFFRTVPAGTQIGMPTLPWFYSPPLAPGIVGTPGAEKRFELMSRSRYRLLSNPTEEWDSSILTNERPKYVVVSDYESEDPLRLHIRSAVRFFNKLNQAYVQAALFDNRLRLDGIDFGPTARLPHDLKYMAPTIRVYRRK